MAEAAALCDRIVLIHRGERLLYGTLGEIQERFSERAVVVRGDAVPTEPSQYRTVTDAQVSDGSIRFLLRDGASPHDLFRELAALDARVDHFEVATPTLAEIFVRTVRGDRGRAPVG
jgi:ABC-2 type transport system ATP-binding protein